MEAPSELSATGDGRLQQITEQAPSVEQSLWKTIGVLYRWRSLPTRKNMGGATNRPTATHVLEKVSQALAGTSSSGAPADAALDTNPDVDSRGMPWPLFVPLLVANGWFLKPDTFGQAVGGPSAAQRMKRAALRIPIFVAAWIAALFFLPKALVGLAFAAWAAWLAPQIQRLSREFQPILPDD